MKRMQAWRWWVLLLSMGGSMVKSEEFAIQAFDGTGRLTFNAVSNAATYRVEWAPSPAGPWTNFTAAALAMDEIVAKGSGIVTCSVPMCYRVVATVTNAPAEPPPAGMVAIPAGTNSGTDPDYGAYSLTVEAFYMDATEVTKAQWDAVADWAVANGYVFDNDLFGEGPHGQGKAADHPVHTVNWYDCVKWCNARSEKEGRTPCYNLSTWACNFAANGYRLPTNTEWAYAARGGASSRRFPWGDTIDHSRANYYSSSSYSYDTSSTRGYHPTYATGGDPYTSPAGSFAANGYGLYDMAGNVWEWSNDSSGSPRYIRGGGWHDLAFGARCGFSYLYDPVYAGSYDGFRTVCR